VPPVPPIPPVVHGHVTVNPDISVHIHNGKIEIDGIRGMVQTELERAMRTLDANKDLPPEMRAKLRAKLERLRGKLDRRLSRLDLRDLDKLGEELNEMGSEIGSEMEGFGADMDKWGQEFGKKFGQDFAKRFAHPPRGPVDPYAADDDHDSDHDNDSGDDGDSEPAAEAVRSMGHLSLTPAQRIAIQQERDTTQQRIEGAKAQLDTASRQLEEALHHDAPDTEIARLIDAVSMHEAELRKAKILGWRHVRGMLQDDQRKAVERAARGRSQ
jgi:hypothetical protein